MDRAPRPAFTGADGFGAPSSLSRAFRGALNLEVLDPKSEIRSHCLVKIAGRELLFSVSRLGLECASSPERAPGRFAEVEP